MRENWKTWTVVKFESINIWITSRQKKILYILPLRLYSVSKGLVSFLYRYCNYKLPCFLLTLPYLIFSGISFTTQAKQYSQISFIYISPGILAKSSTPKTSQTFYHFCSWGGKQFKIKITIKIFHFFITLPNNLVRQSMVLIWPAPPIQISCLHLWTSSTSKISDFKRVTWIKFNEAILLFKYSVINKWYLNDFAVTSGKFIIKRNCLDWDGKYTKQRNSSRRM